MTKYALYAPAHQLWFKGYKLGKPLLTPIRSSAAQMPWDTATSQLKTFRTHCLSHNYRSMYIPMLCPVRYY